MGAKYCDERVRLSIFPWAYLRNYVSNLLCVLPVAMARLSFGCTAIRHVLAVYRWCQFVRDAQECSKRLNWGQNGLGSAASYSNCLFHFFVIVNFSVWFVFFVFFFLFRFLFFNICVCHLLFLLIDIELTSSLVPVQSQISAGQNPTLAGPAVPLAACVQRHPCTKTIKICLPWQFPLRDRKTNFRLIIYSHSSINRHNLAKIRSV